MSVSQLYQKDVGMVSPDKTIIEVLQALIDGHHNSILVVNNEKEPIGIITIQDIAGAIVPTEFLENPKLADAMYSEDFFSERCEELKQRPVSEIMRKDFITVDINDNTLAVITDYLQHDTYFLPVTENGKVIGVITRSNVKKAIGVTMGLKIPS